MDIKITQDPTRQSGLTASKKIGEKRDYSFIMDYDYKAGALFLYTAGKAGAVIYNYLKFKKGMNGDQFYVIPNEHVFVKYKINRQRISEAILLLEAEGLIKTIKTKGKSTRVRLLTKVIKYEKEST